MRSRPYRSRSGQRQQNRLFPPSLVRQNELDHISCGSPTSLGPGHIVAGCLEFGDVTFMKGNTLRS